MTHSKQHEQHTQHKQQAAEASAQGIQAQHTKGTGQTDLMAPVYSTTHKAPSYLNLRWHSTYTNIQHIQHTPHVQNIQNIPPIEHHTHQHKSTYTPSPCTSCLPCWGRPTAGTFCSSCTRTPRCAWTPAARAFRSAAPTPPNVWETRQSKKKRLQQLHTPYKPKTSKSGVEFTAIYTMEILTTPSNTNTSGRWSDISSRY